MSGLWNTREVKHFFGVLEEYSAGPELETNKANMLSALNMTLEEYNWNIQWIEDLIRDYYKGKVSKDHKPSNERIFLRVTWFEIT